eukprot:5083599-Pleurochrysis_carterae.AAC.4
MRARIPARGGLLYAAQALRLAAAHEALSRRGARSLVCLRSSAYASSGVPPRWAECAHLEQLSPPWGVCMMSSGMRTCCLTFSHVGCSALAPCAGMQLVLLPWRRHSTAYLLAHRALTHAHVAPPQLPFATEPFLVNAAGAPLEGSELPLRPR